MTAVLTRIIMRYLSGALVAYGVVTQDVGAELLLDPDLAILVGGIVGGATELVYGIARKNGWTT